MARSEVTGRMLIAGSGHQYSFIGADLAFSRPLGHSAAARRDDSLEDYVAHTRYDPFPRAARCIL